MRVCAEYDAATGKWRQRILTTEENSVRDSDAAKDMADKEARPAKDQAKKAAWDALTTDQKLDTLARMSGLLPEEPKPAEAKR